MPGAPRLAISTVCLSGTLEDKLRAAAAAGFTGVEMLEYDLVMSPWSPRRVAEEAAGLGLSIEVYQPFHVETVAPGPVPGEPASRRAEVRPAGRARREASWCAARRGPRGDSTTTTWLRSSCTRWPTAPSSAGCDSRTKPCRGGGCARTRTPGGSSSESITRRSGCVSTASTCCPLGNDPAVIAQVAVDKVFHVQLADAPRLNLDVREWSLHHRMFPGQGSLDVAGFLRQILAMGYAGPMALEVFNDVYQQEDPRHAATDAMRSMLALAEAVGTRGLLEVPGAAPRRRSGPGSGARRVRVRRARRGRGVGSAGLTHADRPRVRPCRAAPFHAGAAVGAGSRPSPAQSRAAAIDRPRHRVDLCARRRERGPGRSRCSGRLGCWRRSFPGHAGPTRPI